MVLFGNCIYFGLDCVGEIVNVPLKSSFKDHQFKDFMQGFNKIVRYRYKVCKKRILCHYGKLGDKSLLYVTRGYWSAVVTNRLLISIAVFLCVCV